MSGCPKRGSSTIPGRATKAAAQPARNAPATSHECAATSRSAPGSIPHSRAAHVVDRGMGLEPAHRVGRQDALEISGQARVVGLRLYDRLSGVGERAKAQARLVQPAQTVRHLRMRRQFAHATENGFPVVLGEKHIVDRGRHLERRRADSTEVRIGLEKLLQPDPSEHVPDDDLEWIVRLALESRRRVKEQQKRVFKSEFGDAAKRIGRRGRG